MILSCVSIDYFVCTQRSIELGPGRKVALSKLLVMFMSPLPQNSWRLFGTVLKQGRYGLLAEEGYFCRASLGAEQTGGRMNRLCIFFLRKAKSPVT